MKRAIACLLTLLAAVSTEAAGKDAPSSEALQVARAAGFKKIRDYTSSDAKAAQRPQGAPGLSGTMAAIGAGTAAGVFTPPKGLSSGTAAGMSLAGAFLLSLPVAYAETSPRFLAWMPKELATTPEAAADALSQTLTRAMIETLPGAQVELKIREVEKKTQIRRYIAIDEPRCRDCRLWVPAIDLGRLPKIGKAPAFLGGAEAYIWGRPGYRGEGLLAGYPWTAESMTPADRVEVMRNLSAKLPPWMYLYIPPDPKFAPYPQMFHQGEVLLFIEPGLQ